MNLCKNCKFYSPSTLFSPKFWGAECRHPNNIVVDPVNGKPSYRYSPSVLRTCLCECGIEARWFEGKEQNENNNSCQSTHNQIKQQIKKEFQTSSNS